ncbi:MAG TPA: TonB family protein [Bacteroidia bacterium]|jgi:protein TonB|nr:TonB family protein [Bacteroidia bacterium]
MAESIFNRWNNVVAEGRNELVFADRNKLYGAYELRRRYKRNVALSLAITTLTLAALVSVPYILDYLNRQKEEEVVAVDITPTDLTAPPPIDETEPPPPPPPPPPVMETVKFTPPVVTDEEVVEDPPPVQTEETPQISTVTQEGSGEEEIVIPENTGGGVVESAPEQIFTVVEQPATFPGGEAAMQKWIANRIDQKGYPPQEKEAGISGTCYVTFVVEKDGSITDIKLLRGVSGGPGYNKLAQEVVKEMPAWKPGKQNGHEVRVQFNLPIRFVLK